MLKSIFSVFLFLVISCNLYAGENACRTVIKSFWDAGAFCKPEAMQYVNRSSFKEGRKKRDMESFENHIKNFNLYKNMVKQKKYSEAFVLFRKMLELSNARVVKRDNRTWEEYSEKEKQDGIKFMNFYLQAIQRYMVQQSQTMQIKTLSVNGSKASAVITYKDPLKKNATVNMTLVKINGKWLIDDIEKIVRQ